MVRQRFGGIAPNDTMTKLDDTAARLDRAMDALEAATLPLAQLRAKTRKDTTEIAGLTAERESLLARVAELEEETRSLAGITEEVEGRLDGAIAEIRSALGR
jgi:DNA repair ATPase RecN